MKLIHCADLHLDSRLDTHLPEEKARLRSAELLGTFLRLVRSAAERQVDAVLLAGDVFDTKRASARTAGELMEAIRAAAPIQFYYLKGNHDEANRAFWGQTLPENLHLFGREWTCYRLGELVIAGIEPDASAALTLYDSLALPAETTNIVLLHGQIATQPGEEMICLPRLKGKNIDYLALGHLHSYQEAMLDDRGRWCYSGCLEGRGFDECGEKGFSLVETDGKTLTSRFVPFAKRILHEVKTDITGLETVTQLREAMERASAGLPPQDIVKFTLRGSCTPQTNKDLDYLTQAFAEKFFFVRIKDESRLALPEQEYIHDASLKGAFLRLVAQQEPQEADRQAILRCGLAALQGEEIIL